MVLSTIDQPMNARALQKEVWFQSFTSTMGRKTLQLQPGLLLNSCYLKLMLVFTVLFAAHVMISDLAWIDTRNVYFSLLPSYD